MRRAGILLLLLVATGTTSSQHAPVGTALGPVLVLGVVDGDTVMLGSDLGPRTVRLIGVDSPETRHPQRGAEAFGAQATAFLERSLPVGTLVWVELDVQREDVHGRLLAYLYREDPAGAWLIDGRRATQVNLHIAEAGFARVLTIPPNVMYADLYERAVEEARVAQRGMWAPPGPDPPRTAAEDTLPHGAIVIACALYDPDTPNDAGAEWVSLLVREPLATRGFYLWDEGSRTRLPLPPGVQEPGEIRILNPGQGIWNNRGDTIYLKRGDEIVDAWDYSAHLAPQGSVVCRGEP
jgi:micrococcal nuclease